MRTPVTDGAKLYPLAIGRPEGVGSRCARGRAGLLLAAVALMATAGAGCGTATGNADPNATPADPVYDRASGRLERLESDQNGDGEIDAVAFMDGAHIKHVEIDRDFDGTPDRWEYYVPNPSGEVGPGSPDGRNLLDRAEEMTPDGTVVTRRETYESGLMKLVEEDVDADGRMDKWEHYSQGNLSRVELDLQGAGFPDRRLVYGDRGGVVRVEADPDGDGVFEVVDPVQQGGSGSPPSPAAGEDGR